MPILKIKHRFKSLSEIRLILLGNGPANDNNQNLKYKDLDDKIEKSYAEHSTATLKNSLYDSYIRAIKWGSERLGNNQGIMALITNAGWIDSNSADGMRNVYNKNLLAFMFFICVGIKEHREKYQEKKEVKFLEEEAAHRLPLLYL